MTCFSRGRRLFTAAAAALSALALVAAAPYNATYDAWNLNKNQAATDPTQYTTTRANTTYTPSPSNWRSLPFYTILLDKFADGDPTNNNFFGLKYEHDWHETQMRFGGDIKGLKNKLDYLQGMNIRGVYIAGTIFLNMPWQADSYSPLDFTTLDPHWGTIDDWVEFIDEIHARNMYIMMDFTVGTMGDMIGFQGHLNESTPFSLDEYDAVWKKPSYTPWDFETYKDFSFGNGHNSSCVMPQFWWENGTQLTITTNGCKASDFDQYGDLEAFGVHPDWQRQLTKFASVQDRLREWQPAVMARLQNFVCMVITALDIDAIRIDKSTQVTLDALASWTTAARKCAASHGKNDFLIVGEVTGGNTFGALYYGRGRTPNNLPNPDLPTIYNISATDDQFFLRDYGHNGLDGACFHYSIYRGLERFLGMDGNLQVADDVQVNFVDAWNQIFVTNDFLNPSTNVTDPRHMFGTSNFDIFRWPSLVNGTQKSALATFITSLLMPGIPLLYYGEEQAFAIYDNGASNYLYGRQAMPGNKAWQRHGCYKLGSDQFYGFPLQKAITACMDDTEALDHFDPTAESRRLFKQFYYLREQYAALTDGLALVQRGNWTHLETMPGSNQTATELGLWTASRAGIPNAQTLTGSNYTADVWMLYTNENMTQTYTFDCKGSSWISTPYESGTTIKNLVYPFETYQLVESQSPFFNDGKAPFVGCLQSISMDPFSFKIFVPEANWVSVPPMLTKFSPGHDARLLTVDGDNNSTNIDIRLEFNVAMASCDAVTNALSFNVSSSGTGSTPSVTNVQCGNLPNPDPPTIIGSGTSSWSWNATLTNVPDGIIMLTLDNPASSSGITTGAKDHLLLRKGKADNVMVFPDSDYDNSAFTFDSSSKTYTFTHKAIGADKFRYSVDFAQTWSQWMDWEATTTIDNGTFFGDKNRNWWEGQHVIVQYWSETAASAYHAVHADHDYGFKRRVPQFLARGPFNTWGFDSGVRSQMEQTGDNTWELEIMTSWPAFVQLNVYGFDDYFYGDTDGDGILDRLPPNSVAANYVNMSAPPKPHLAWKLVVDDHLMSWTLEPKGESSVAAILYALLLSIPVITGTLAVLIFMWSFYGIKYNKWGLKENKPSHSNYFPILGSLGNKSTHDLKDGANEKHGHTGLAYTGEMIGWPEDKNKRRCVLIATLEYEIIDWKLKVKIGGLGVMSSLMGKAMTDVDLIWVIPKVKDLEYPPGEPAEPIEVIIFGEPYLIEVETHVLDNITYVILDSPVFRAQTKADPYPARMDDLSSAIFYSTWNQAIAATVRRFPQIDIYHINDYHGALVPIYLLPKVLPVCLSLHNAEFQGLWPLRTKEEMKEVCSAFNISKEHCTKYVQFGNTFNLLHAAASFISVHQKSIGVAGVSDKYGKRSWARYPALWTLKHVDSLPNPDPTDIAALDENPVALKEIRIDDEAEAKRPEYKRQAQEWAGIKQDPKADLFVFVGRWSKQKGVDLIADVMPSLLEKRSSIQLICVGPVIDLYGRFAAEKLARLMEIYPDRVYSKPEFTALPPYLFSGADFALIPSRDEPFGLVAVEFGRKGALGVGSRLGGLGLMPGWWFPVESTSTAHMLSQLSKTIKMALKSTEEERALLRARSAVQRFPVVEWRQRMEDFHKRSIGTSRQVAGHNAWRQSDGELVHAPQVAHLDHDDWDPVYQAEPTQPQWDTRSMMENSRMSNVPPSPGIPNSPGQWSQSTLAPPRIDEHGRRPSTGSDDGEDYFSTARSRAPSTIGTPSEGGGFDSFLAKANKTIAKEQKHAPDPFLDDAAPKKPFGPHSRNSSRDSIASIVDEKANSPLNKAIASFTDADGEVAQEFIQKLQNLSSENSKSELSIERYLQKSEEAFFDKVRKEKLSTAASIRSSTRDSVWGTPSEYEPSRPHSPSTYSFAPSSHYNGGFNTEEYSGPLPNEKGEVVMTRLQIALSHTIGGWPLYTIIIAAGQMLGATSFQITLLSGQNFQTDLQLYVLGGIFLASSAVWYTAFRLKPSVYVLSAPWIFFGIAFFIIALPAVSSVFDKVHYALQSAATWSYAVASSAAFLFFGLNFGEEAGAATEVWTLRACVVQGSQQIWVAALWYWGHQLNGSTATAPPWWIVLVLWPLAIMSFVFAYLLLYGLPDYYRQVPPKVPNFLKTLFRRKLVLWFLASEILRDYWLSGPYGRNWSFLWSVPIPKWATLLLIITFFVVVWGILMVILTYFSKTHTWLLPVFAVGLGAPRWAQMLWGTSSIAYYLPWAGKSGPYLGVSLWLWLGVLDAVQGVGLGMILLQTLSRLHVCATLAFAQIIGSICVMVARASAPNRIGPGNVFPDVGTWDMDDGVRDSPIGKPAFWIALICQLVIVIGYFWFYRKEQLSRP
ncbi:modular protein with glycoside hydrolase family 13 and glycosyltransferase family 5 domains [Fomitiporia mediterranea MF3/22]|uniref:modular protein with glycoside hydrolase family 13 and glycosyltransferase family 5 domains n=1 Tax=Fomitiporia mediterranea (strain MF3/22) TaxID=694068 RepID=UPI00044077F9|nr:modular protein with glycoside hydrolase family 13 and glycosyltransferase family 5 domains [Fomitiporia mediterranea MF3/22]EJD02308.1 modular protein with glycoside hydrolase family 13 and glycosyltransferase family 5 domains [Fomitiporia mediterranea MF3/22]